MNDRENNEMRVAMPSQDVFQGKHAIEETIMYKGLLMNVMERVEYPPEGGIYVYYRGMPYPKKGLPFPDAVHANDTMKRILAVFFRMLASKSFLLPILGAAVTPWPWKIKMAEKAVKELGRISQWVLTGIFLKPERYSNPVRGMRALVEEFLAEAGIRDDLEGNFALMIATVMEYDDAYRLRFQDMMSETTKEALMAKPWRELRRISALGLEREPAPQVKDSFRAVRLILSVAFLHPKIRGAFRRALASLSGRDFAWMQLDNADRYHVLVNGSYDFLGRSIKERSEIFVDLHTKSKCCGAGVEEKKIAEDKWETSCKRCKRLCAYEQNFPQYIQVEGIEREPKKL